MYKVFGRSYVFISRMKNMSEFSAKPFRGIASSSVTEVHRLESRQVVRYLVLLTLQLQLFVI
jgi:hypothetical protein